MVRRSRLAALLAMLIILVSITAAGCTGSSNQHPDGTDMWSWNHKGSSTEIMLNGKLYAVVQSGVAKIYLPDGRSLDTTVNKDGTPGLITRMLWGVSLYPQDYAQMNRAFQEYRDSVNQGNGGTLGWVIFLLIVILAGVLLFIYAGSLVNSWKLGGIFSGTDTARSLLLFKAVGILLVAVGVIILLVVVVK